MFNRGKKLEEEAKKEENYRPTSELQEESEEKPHIEVPWTALIIVGVLLVLAIVCIIVIFTMGGPVK